MSLRRVTRRDMLLTSAATAGISATNAAQAGATTQPDTRRMPESKRPLSIVCVGAHPDDPEETSFGTLARYAEAGHRVTVLYLTRGERGIRGKSLDEAAAIRTAEAEAACKIIGATPVFAGQIDGDTEVNTRRIADFTKLLAAQKPDVVFTHWPIDTHADHQAASILTQQAHLQVKEDRFRLYFFEVESGYQSLGFVPQIYVDISATLAKKRSAFFCHVSQHGEETYRAHSEIIERFRGREIGVTAAETFIPMARNDRGAALPGLDAL